MSMQQIMFASLASGSDFVISGSGLFDGSSGFLSRTLSTPTDNNVWTFECIFKKPTNGSAMNLLNSTTGGTSQAAVVFNGTTDEIRCFDYTGSFTWDIQASAKLRDPSAFYQLTVTVNTGNAAAADRVQLAINGTRLTAYTTQTNPSTAASSLINTANRVLAVGVKHDSTSELFDGYVARAILIDGQALDPTSFGSVTDDGFWQINKVEENYAIIGADVTGAATDNSVSASVASTYTFSNQAIGTATSDRVVIVNFGSLKETSAAYSVTSVTIGGVAATQIHSAQTQTYYGLSSYYATVPTGTTADIVIVHSANMNRCGIQVVTTTNIGELHQVALAEASAGSDALSFTVDVPAGSLVVGYVYDTNSSSQTWTELTENFDEQISATHYHSGAIKNYSSAATPTITADPSGSATTFGLVAVFQPESEGVRFGNNGFLLTGQNVSTGTDSSTPDAGYAQNDSIPTMTDTSAPSGTAIFDSQSYPTYAAWKAFDKSTASRWARNAAGQAGWIGYDFGTGKVIKKMIFTAPNASLGAAGEMPKNYTIDGWNGSAWVTITTITNAASYSADEQRVHTFTNTTSYTKYRVNITASFDGANCTMAELAMFEGGDGVNHFTKTGTITATNDSPTNDADDGYGNYATFNPLIPDTNAGTPVYTNGNRHFANASGTGYCGASTLAINSGKFYVEIKPNTFVNDEEIIGFALASSNVWGSTAQLGNASGQGAGLHTLSTSDTKLKIDGGSLTTVDTKMLSPDRTIIAIDSEAGKGWLGFYDNSGSVSRWVDTSGTTRTTDQPAAGTNATWTFTANEAVLVGSSLYGDGNTDIYADSGDWLGTPPSGFVSMGTQNLPTPDVINYEDEYYIEAGISHSNGSTTAVTLPKSVSGGAMVRIKRTDSTGDWYVFDTVRGANKSINWNDAVVEDTSTFDDQTLSGTSFVIPSAMASGSYLLECFYMGSYFQIKEYTGTGSAHAETYSAALDTAPGFMITITRTTTSGPTVYHSALGATKYLRTDTTAAAVDSASRWNDVEPTTTQFTVGTSDPTNANGVTIISYHWANSGPYSFGSATANASTDGPFISIPGSPKSLTWKNASAAQSWFTTVVPINNGNVMNTLLLTDTTDAAYTSSATLDIVSNGAKIRSNGGGTPNTTSGNTIITMAFGIQPLTDGAINQGRAR